MTAGTPALEGRRGSALQNLLSNSSPEERRNHMHIEWAYLRKG